MRFERIADIAGLLGRALGIDQDRQIPADPERIHVVEEDRALGIEQILHIVLGGRDQHVDAGGVHQGIELGRIERDGARLGRTADAFLHDGPPLAVIELTALPALCFAAVTHFGREGRL